MVCLLYHKHIVIVIAVYGQNESMNLGPVCNIELYDEFLADKGKDIFVLSSQCEAAIIFLKERLAGHHGPVLLEDMRVIMCSDECLANDILHVTAMKTSLCTCSELSSKNSHIALDFCRQNSGLFVKLHVLYHNTCSSNAVRTFRLVRYLGMCIKRLHVSST